MSIQTSISSAGRWLVGAALACISAASAEAAVVTGTFKYSDSGGAMPIRRAQVEVWYRGPRVFDSWGVVATVRTSAKGSISFTDGRASGTYSLRIYAWNDGAIVYPMDYHFSPYYAVPPDNGPQFHLSPTAADSVLDFSWTFTDPYVSREFNLANAAQFGFEYADARRDPMETDSIPQVNIQPTSWFQTGTATYANPGTNTIMIHISRGFDDQVILHEYAHLLQHHISGEHGWPSVHDGCAMRLTPGGNLVNSPEYAWTEGFAEYFSLAVRRVFANEPSISASFTPTREAYYESPSACSVVGASSQWGHTITPAMVEDFITASLWDLVDAVGNPSQGFEAHDTVGGEDVTVFRIFDREMKLGTANIFTFRTAWGARGKSVAAFDCILSYYGIVPAMSGCRPGAVKLAGDFNNDRRTDIALTAVLGWGSIPVAFSNGDGSFNVTNQTAVRFASLAAAPSAVKLTGDFDGDGDTDIALTGGRGFTSIPVALSNGDGSFTLHEEPMSMFPELARRPENRKLVGDFDGNGTADIALVGAPGSGSVAVAWGNRMMPGTFSETIENLGNALAVKASLALATIVPGDFTGDGASDFVVMLPGARQIGLAISFGNGQFYVTDIDGGDFPMWATTPGAKLLTGDFDGDRISDLALTGPSGWVTVPMLLSSHTGLFTVVNAPVGNFATWSAAAGAVPLVGDFSGTGAADIALTGVVGWSALPVAVTSGTSFVINNPFVGDFAIWATTLGVKPIIGDFNGDGRADVALTGAAGWGSVPVAFSQIPRTFGTGGSGGFTTAGPSTAVSFAVTNRAITDFAFWSSIVQ